MDKVAGHPRLYRRGAVYWHRGAIPADIRDSYPKSEETFSLKTRDYREALRLVRVASVDVDRKFDEHRRSQKSAQGPSLKELSSSEIKKLGDLYHAMLLEEDDETRLEGFWEQGELPELPKPSFEEHEDDIEGIDEATRHDYARGKVEFFLDEAEEVLSWTNVNIRLDPKSPSRRLLARELQGASIRAYETIKARNRGDVIETPVVEGPESATDIPLLSVAAKDWVTEKSKTSWVEKTAGEHRVWFNHFVTVNGDKPLDQYSKADGRRFKALLERLPANWNKKEPLKGLPVDRAATKAQEIGMKPMADRNANKLIGFVSSFWTWAEDHYDEAPGGVMRGLKFKIKKNVREERDPFTKSELEAIFSAPIFTGCRSVHHWKQKGNLVPRDAGRFWVPLIGLYSGARLGEIIQLYVDDVREEDGIMFFDIVKNGDDKHIKNLNSERRIPVHPHLMSMGFGKLLEARRKEGAKRMFPDLPIGADGYYSSPFSAYFRGFLKDLGIKHAKNAFHSFRHCFEDACRDSDVPKEIMDALQGHGEAGMSGRYGRGYDLRKLNGAMETIEYRDLDLSHLHVD